MALTEAPKDRELPPTKEQIYRAVFDGLKRAYQLHQSLGDEGRTALSQNEFGDLALVMDVEAENTVLNSLRKLNIPLQIFSEEHGSFTDGENPAHTIILDGLDGSAEYKEKRGESMYGTMVSVMDGNNPTYDDYLVSGIMIHSPRPELLIAIKGEGCFRVDIATGERELIEKKPKSELSQDTVIDLDINWPLLSGVYEDSENKKNFPFMQCAFRSQAARTALFINGAIDFQLEVTRKGSVEGLRQGNLEMPPTYGLVRELGGVMVTAEGASLGSRQYRTFDQDGVNIPIIVAPNQEHAAQLANRLSLNVA